MNLPSMLRIRRISDVEFASLHDASAYRVLEKFVGSTSIYAVMAEPTSTPGRMVLLVFDVTGLCEAMEIYDGTIKNS